MAVSRHPTPARHATTRHPPPQGPAPNPEPKKETTTMPEYQGPPGAEGEEPKLDYMSLVEGQQINDKGSKCGEKVSLTEKEALALQAKGVQLGIYDPEVDKAQQAYRAEQKKAKKANLPEDAPDPDEPV